MIVKTERNKIDIAVNEWSRYVEIFRDSKVSVMYLKSKGFTWEDIAKLYSKAIETNQEINLEEPT